MQNLYLLSHMTGAEFRTPVFLLININSVQKYVALEQNPFSDYIIQKPQQLQLSCRGMSFLHAHSSKGRFIASGRLCKQPSLTVTNLIN